MWERIVKRFCFAIDIGFLPVVYSRDEHVTFTHAIYLLNKYLIKTSLVILMICIYWFVLKEFKTNIIIPYARIKESIIGQISFLHFRTRIMFVLYNKMFTKASLLQIKQFKQTKHTYTLDFGPFSNIMHPVTKHMMRRMLLFHIFYGYRINSKPVINCVFISL